MQHIHYPIVLDVGEFNEMSDDEIASYIDKRLDNINLQINSDPNKKPVEKNLTPNEIKTEFKNLRKSLGIPESFKSFFVQRQTTA